MEKVFPSTTIDNKPFPPPFESPSKIIWQHLTDDKDESSLVDALQGISFPPFCLGAASLPPPRISREGSIVAPIQEEGGAFPPSRQSSSLMEPPLPAIENNLLPDSTYGPIRGFFFFFNKAPPPLRRSPFPSLNSRPLRLGEMLPLYRLHEHPSVLCHQKSPPLPNGSSSLLLRCRPPLSLPPGLVAFRVSPLPDWNRNFPQSIVVPFPEIDPILSSFVTSSLLLSSVISLKRMNQLEFSPFSYCRNREVPPPPSPGYECSISLPS